MPENKNWISREGEGAHVSWRRDTRDAWRDILPLCIAMIPIAMLFGTQAVAKGLSLFETFLMSLIVFAGGSQFAAIELWGQPIPILAILFSTLLINARHLLMGVSLAPKLGIRKPWRWVAVFFLTDEIWAVSEKQALKRPVSMAYWFAMVSVFPTTWVLASVAGALVGPLLGPPERIGADFAFTAVFIALVVGFERTRVMITTVIVAGASAALVYYVFGSPWHIMAGSFCGIAAAYLSAGKAGTGEAHNVAA